MRNSPNYADISGPDNGTFLPPAPGANAAANGRIDLLSPPPAYHISTFAYQAQPEDNASFRSQAMTGITVRTPVSDLYFSPENMSALQEGIRYRVYRESGGQYVIGRQSDTELRVIMRSVYLEYGLNQPGNVVGQVRELNSRVLDWAVREILSNLKQHTAYLKDASTLPVPLDKAELLTKKGSRSLEMTKSFF